MQYIAPAPHPFDMDDIDIDVTFLRNGTPMASITFEVNNYKQNIAAIELFKLCRLHLFVTIS